MEFFYRLSRMTLPARNNEIRKMKEQSLNFRLQYRGHMEQILARAYSHLPFAAKRQAKTHPYNAQLNRSL